MLTILIPTDFSKAGMNAVRFGVNLSKKIPSKFMFFHSVPMPAVATPDIPVLPFEFDKEPFIKTLSSYVEKVFKSLKLKPDPNRITYMASGGFSVATDILEVADKYKPDLIILGIRGKKGLNKIAVGSNARKVISASNFPVIAVPESYPFKPIKKILHASDLRNLKEELNIVIPWVKLFTSKLEIAYISDVTEESIKLISNAEKEIRKRAYKNIRFYTESIQYGQSLTADIKQLVERHRPDMVVMFRHHHNWLGKLFVTSHTEQLAFEIKVPLLAVNLKSLE